MAKIYVYSWPTNTNLLQNQCQRFSWISICTCKRALGLNGGASGGRVGCIINNSVASLMELVGYRAEANTGMWGSLQIFIWWSCCTVFTFNTVSSRLSYERKKEVLKTEWRKMLPEEDIGHDFYTEADLKAVHIYRRFGRHIERCFRKLWGTRYTVLGGQCKGGRVWWTPTVQRQVTRSSGRSLLGRCELQLTRRPAELSRLFAVWIDKTLQFELHGSSRSFSSSFDFFAPSSISS